MQELRQEGVDFFTVHTHASTYRIIFEVEVVQV